MSSTPTRDAIDAMPDDAARAIGLSLSPEALALLIPHGNYCYEVLGPAENGGRKTRPCPFARGKRPDGTVCLINPAPDYADDPFFNIDLCKGCGINVPDEPPEAA